MLHQKNMGIEYINKEQFSKEDAKDFFSRYGDYGINIFQALYIDNTLNIEQNIRALATLVEDIIMENELIMGKIEDKEDANDRMHIEIKKTDLILSRLPYLLKNIFSVDNDKFNKYSNNFFNIIKQYIHSKRCTSVIYHLLYTIGNEQGKKNFIESVLNYALEYDDYYNTNPFILSLLIDYHIKDKPGIELYYNNFLEEKGLEGIQNFWIAGGLKNTSKEAFKYRKNNTLPVIEKDTQEKLKYIIEVAIKNSPTSSTKSCAVILSILFDIEIIELVKRILHIKCIQYLEDSSNYYDIDGLAYYIYILSGEEPFYQLIQLHEERCNNGMQEKNEQIKAIIKTYLIGYLVTPITKFETLGKN